jgi:hypothetical protein
MKVTAFLLASSIVAVSAAASDDVHAAKIALRGANVFEADGKWPDGGCRSECIDGRYNPDPGKCQVRSEPCPAGTTCANCLGQCFYGISSICTRYPDNVEAEAQQ